MVTFVRLSLANGTDFLVATKKISAVYQKDNFDKNGESIPHTQCFVYSEDEEHPLAVNHTIEQLAEKLQAG